MVSVSSTIAGHPFFKENRYTDAFYSINFSTQYRPVRVSVLVKGIHVQEPPFMHAKKHKPCKEV